MNGTLRALLAVFVSMYAATAWAQATAQVNGTAGYTDVPYTDAGDGDRIWWYQKQ